MKSTDEQPDLSGAEPRRWPLSYIQEFLWFLGTRWPEAGMVEHFTVSLTEPLDVGVPLHRIREVLTHVVREHEVLRSAIVRDGDSVAVIVADEVELPLVVHDLGDADEETFDEVIAACIAQPVPATNAPAIRFDVVRGERQSYLNLTAHHLFFDHWSGALLRRQIRRLLQTAADQPLPAPDVGPQYLDFTVWERELVQGPSLQRGVDYWVERLADLPLMDLPTDRRRPWLRSSAAARSLLTFAAGDYEKVERLAARLGSTPFMVLASLFMALLSQLTGRRDVAIPIVFAGHRTRETTDLLGYFDNLLFLRAAFDPEDTVADALSRARSEFLEAYEHHEVPILTVMQRQPRLFLLLADPRNVWVLFHLQVDPDSLARRDHGAAAAEDTTASHMLGSALPGRAAPAGHVAAQEDAPRDGGLASGYNFGADLDVTLREVDGGLQVAVLYSLDLFDGARVVRWMSMFRDAVHAAVSDPEQPLSRCFPAVGDES